MAIEFSCSCGQKFRVADEHAGRKTKCKACGEAIAIPTRKARTQPATKAGEGAGNPESGRPRPPVAKKSAPKSMDELFVLEPSETDDNSEDESEFDFAIEETRPAKRLPGKSGGSKKKKKPVDDSDGAPKSKKKKSAERSEGLPTPAIIGLVVFGLLGLSGVGFAVTKMLGGAGGGAAKAVEKQFSTFRHDLGQFSIEHPSDWEASGFGGSGGVLPGALFKGDDASVRVRADQNGSSVGTIAQAGSNLGFSIPGADGVAEEMPDELDPVAAVHEFQVNDLKGDYSDYQETPPEILQSDGFGEGRLSIFTGSSGLFSSEKGFRCTFLASDFQYNIVCKVPAKQFDAFEPIFRRMIQSFKR